MGAIKQIDSSRNPETSKITYITPYDPNHGGNQNASVNAQSAEQEPSLKDLISLVKKRLKLIAIITGSFTFLSIVYCVLATKYYTAIANVEIKGYAPVLAGGAVENIFGADSRRLDYQKTTTAKLKDLAVADRVLANTALAKRVQDYFDSRQSFSLGDIVGLFISKPTDDDSDDGIDEDKNFKNDPALLNDYLGLIDITPIHETSIVSISATSASPHLSQLLANAHAEGFIEQLRSEREKTVVNSLKALQSQGEELRRKLEGTEQDLANYAEKNQLVAVSNAEDANVIVKQILSLTDLLTQATARRVKSESLLREFETQRSKYDSANVDEQGQQGVRAELDQAQAEYAAMRQNVTDQFPAAKELKARINSLQSSLTGSSKRQVENLRFLYQSDLSAEKKLIEQIDQAKTQAHEMSKRLVQYNMLLKESASVRQLYETVLQQIQETQISGSNDNSNIIVSDYAARPTVPSAPLTKLVVLAATFLGGLVAILTVVLLEAFNNRIRTPDDVTNLLDLPILGYIPAFGQHDAKISMFSKENLTKKLSLLKRKGPDAKLPPPPSLDAPADISPQVATESPTDSLITITSPKAFVSEALRTIRASILLSSADHAPQTIMITSSEKGEGKTTVTANLAVAFAQAGHRTLLVDADLRQSKLSGLFNIPGNHPGLSDYLAGQRQPEEIICRTAIENAHVLVSGSVPPNPAELLGSKKMKELIESLREAYDFILIDCPPVLPVADGLMVSRIADAVVFVTRSNKTDRGASLEARRRLRNVNARILGVVLNDLDFSTVDHGVGSLSSHNYYTAAQG